MSLPTLTAIVTAHEDTPYGIIENLASQTCPPQQVLCAVSDWKGDTVNPPRNYPFELSVDVHPNRNDFGYRKRNKLLPLATSEFVCFCCHDDSYEPDYIESMLTAAGGMDIAYCWWDEKNYQILGGVPRVAHPVEFKEFDATLGGFIARTELVKRLGGFPLNKVRKSVV